MVCFVLAAFQFDVYLNDLSSTCSADRGRLIIVYADDILLLSPRVVDLKSNSSV